MFKEERKRVLEILGDKALAIEHIGSTSVPGLGAKDIVDFVVGVDRKGTADKSVDILQTLDYTDITLQPGHTEWFYCLGKTPGIFPRFHLHLMKYPSPFFNKHILFRDYLRGHLEVAAEYFELKKRLADRYGRDRLGYTDAKTDFIEEVFRKARSENPYDSND
ncbi:GrpB family protein [candidate division WOR-3 bacterium]|nr:GrpB family protein [candidate division WOR-3 bacterium]